jgi:TetR/AcrR family transcriptional regulator, mexCD-oprJ operon repressor
VPDPGARKRAEVAPLRRPGLKERVAAEILAAAASVLASSGGQASMNDVATAAGVARGTLYRYFPTRGALVEQLRATAVENAANRLRDSRVSEIDPVDGLERAIRAFLDAGDVFVVGARERNRPGGADFDSSIMRPLRELIERGQAAGAIRDDMDASGLSEALLGLILAGFTSARLGKEDAIASVKQLFLDGARAR